MSMQRVRTFEFVWSGNEFNKAPIREGEPIDKSPRLIVTVEGTEIVSWRFVHYPPMYGNMEDWKLFESLVSACDACIWSLSQREELETE